MMNKFLKKNEGNKEVNNELKEKVSANFDTKKADAILATAGANETTTTESAPSDEVSAKIHQIQLTNKLTF